MIEVECDQGTAEWFAARLGLPTASQFHRIITPKTHKPSGAQDKYADELLAEWLLGQPLETDLAGFAERGGALEQEAVAFYEATRDVDTTIVGFCRHDDVPAGCSPDRLIGDDGGLEMKCPSAAVHVGYLRAAMRGPQVNDYYCQVQGALWVTGRQWWDFHSYNPQLPPALVRYTRDDVFIAKLDKTVRQFVAMLDEEKDKMIKRGYHPPDDGVNAWLKQALKQSLA